MVSYIPVRILVTLLTWRFNVMKKECDFQPPSYELFMESMREDSPVCVFIFVPLISFVRSSEKAVTKSIY